MIINDRDKDASYTSVIKDMYEMGPYLFKSLALGHQNRMTLSLSLYDTIISIWQAAIAWATKQHLEPTKRNEITTFSFIKRVSIPVLWIARGCFPLYSLLLNHSFRRCVVFTAFWNFPCLSSHVFLETACVCLLCHNRIGKEIISLGTRSHHRYYLHISESVQSISWGSFCILLHLRSSSS